MKAEYVWPDGNEGRPEKVRRRRTCGTNAYLSRKDVAFESCPHAYGLLKIACGMVCVCRMIRRLHPQSSMFPHVFRMARLQLWSSFPGNQYGFA